MATRSNINPCESTKKRRKLSGGGCVFQLSWVLSALVGSQVARQESRFVAWHAICILALSTAGETMSARYVAAGTEVDRVTAT